jgi:hypothetical protein
VLHQESAGAVKHKLGERLQVEALFDDRNNIQVGVDSFSTLFEKFVFNLLVAGHAALTVGEGQSAGPGPMLKAVNH